MNYNIVDGSFSNVYILTVVMMEDDICSRDIVSRLNVAICSGEWCYNNDVCVALPSSPAHAAPNQIFHSDHSVSLKILNTLLLPAGRD